VQGSKLQTCQKSRTGVKEEGKHCRFKVALCECYSQESNILQNKMKISDEGPTWSPLGEVLPKLGGTA